MKRMLAGAMLAAGLVLAANQVAAIVTYKLIELDGAVLKWGTPEYGTSAQITVGFVDRTMTTPDARNCRRMQPMAGLLRTAGVDWQLFRAEVRAALDSWQAVAGVTFELVDDASRADILIGAQIKPRGRAYANVAFEPAAATGIGPLTRSFVCLNPEQPWKIGFDGRLDIYDLRYTIQHEIGHAIGLNHPSASGQLMSYRYEELFRGPQSGDIDGARLLYGPPRN